MNDFTCTCDLTTPQNCPRHMDTPPAPKKEPQTYVVGFLFSPNRGQVALIRKNKPKWQAGLLNGIGGKIEPGESAPQAMEREFEEETSVKVVNWRWFATIRGEGFKLTCFTADASAAQFNGLQSITDELIEVVPFTYANDHRDCIPNLRWLIPMALDKDRITANINDNGGRDQTHDRDGR